MRQWIKCRGEPLRGRRSFSRAEILRPEIDCGAALGQCARYGVGVGVTWDLCFERAIDRMTHLLQCALLTRQRTCRNAKTGRVVFDDVVEFALDLVKDVGVVVR